MEPKRGQAVVEYILVLTFVVFLGGRLLSILGDYVGTGMGTLNAVLTDHLSVGVCQSDCFPDSYINVKKLP